MATNTANYGLVKAAPTENYDVAVVNANLDTVDTQIKTRQTNIDNANATIAALTNRVADLEQANAKSVYFSADAAATSLPTAGGSVLINWAAATRNDPTFTKTSATRWTCTKVGIYMISCSVQVTAFQNPTGTRAYLYMQTGPTAGVSTQRFVFTGENLCVANALRELAIGDVVEAGVLITDPTSVTVGINSWLHMVRMGT